MATLDIICQGWLTKSPPERTLDLFGKFPLRFVTHKWRERYFVLHKPSGSLPKEYALDYYRDHTIRKHKGRIDLEQCEEILSALDSAHYEHLFAIKTRHKHRERTYYLAAHTEREMNKWVECLCSVCGLADDEGSKQVDKPVTVQPETADHHKNGHASVLVTQPNITNPDLHDDIPEEIAPPPPTKHPETGRGSPSPYHQLSDCTSGKPSPNLEPDADISKSASQDSLARLPPAPPPPPKEPPNQLDVTFKPPKLQPSKYTPVSDDSYDVPKSSRPVSTDEYDVPPIHRPVPPRLGNIQFSEDLYDVPPPHPLNVDTDCHFRNSHSSNSSQSPRDAQSSFTHFESSAGSWNSAGDVYDTPPPPVLAPRAPTSNSLYSVPPPPSSKKHEKRGELIRDYHYENLPPNSKSHPEYAASHPEPPPPPRCTRDGVYDSPPRRGGLAHSPPPPTPCSKIPHPYVNSPTTYVDPPVRTDEVYVPMTVSGVPSYVPMVDSVPDIELDVPSSPLATPVFHSSFQDEVYVSPPNNQPIKQLSSSPTTPDDFGSEQDTYTIMPTHRTKSFKRREYEPGTDKPISHSVFSRIPLPQRADCIEESSSDEDDESVENLSKGQKAQKGLSSTPPPPRSGRGELEYLDLDLKENLEADKSPAVTRSPPGNVSPTDYKEIDFIKTKALSETRKDVENKRKSSDTA